VGGTVAALAALLAGSTVLAAGATAAPGRSGPEAAGQKSGGRPELHHWMGSSIPSHEGRTTDSASTAPLGRGPDYDWLGSSLAGHEGRAGGRSAAGSTLARTDDTESGTRSVPRTPGFDVSNWQGKVDWPAAYSKGARFAYIKATEGTTYRDPQFDANYVNAYYAGFIRGAYHFATPNTSSGKAQADYFTSHGGAWSKDGKTLPPLLDIEYPDGPTCYGLSQSQMRSWIADFVNEVHAKTTRWAAIYTTTDWWKTCTGNTAQFASNDPLFIARYASSSGTLPAGWPFYTFWQHADSGTFPGDQDYFNGPLSGVRNLANNT
jgi:GH25 family lysozyme M1 (1,4-beta-N-acetylmuramidase)